MTPIGSNDKIAIASGGTLRTENPTAPTITASAGTGQVTITINGDSGVTNYLKYKRASDASWQDGGSRSGDGDLTVTGLANSVQYMFVAYSENGPGYYSAPSNVVTATLAATAAATQCDEMLAGTANDFLAEFGEPVTYKPKGGGSRSILAIIDRNPPAEIPGMPAGAHSSMMIATVANDETDGIGSSEVNCGGDKVELSVRIGETAVEKRITQILNQDAGMMYLAVR